MKIPVFINLQDAVTGKWFLLNASEISTLHQFSGNGYSVVLNSGHSLLLNYRQYRRLLRRMNELNLLP